MAQQHKTCKVCGEVKAINEFPKHKTGKYGVMALCKPCKREYNRRYYETNREKRCESSRKYYESNREKVLGRTNRYYHENRDKALEYNRIYLDENREIHNARSLKKELEKNNLTKMLATVPQYTPWTPEEETFLMEDNGMTVYQKAIELGRTFASCNAKRMRLRKGTKSQTV